MSLEYPYEVSKVVLSSALRHMFKDDRFFGDIVRHMDPKHMHSEVDALIVTEAKGLYTRVGAAPSSPTALLALVKQRVAEGQVDLDEYRAVRERLMDVLDEGYMTANETRDVLKVELQRRANEAALEEGMKQFTKKRSDLSAVERMLANARRIGESDTTATSKLGSAMGEIRKLLNLRVCPTGIPDLDAEIVGMKEEELGVFLGGPGGGKSMALASGAAHSLTRGMNVAFVTLELSRPQQFARIISNLTGLETDDVTTELMIDEAEERLAHLMDNGMIGGLALKEMPAEATTVSDIRDWLVEEKKQGFVPDVLYVDYADELSAQIAKDTPSHEAYGKIYAALRQLTKDDEFPKLRWVWTASQVKTEGLNRNKTKRLEGHHAAGSQKKFQKCDLLVTLNPREDDELMGYVGKNRTGSGAGTEVTWIHNFGMGRISAAVDYGEHWPW